MTHIAMLGGVPHEMVHASVDIDGIILRGPTKRHVRLEMPYPAGIVLLLAILSRVASGERSDGDIAAEVRAFEMTTVLEAMWGKPDAGRLDAEVARLRTTDLDLGVQPF